MTTTTVPVAITCPDWCIVPVEEHAADLWNQDGNCIHWTAAEMVADPAGYLDSQTDGPRHWPQIEVSLTTTSTPEGRPTATRLSTSPGTR